MSSLARFLLLLAIIGESLGMERIIGGKDADTSDAPWIVALVYYSSWGSVYDNQFCGGSIINESWVLTAGHCVIGMDASEFYIVAGFIDLDDTSEGQSKSIEKIILHWNYDDWTLERDIALLQLESPLELNDNVAVIELANEGDPLENGQNYTIAGWGDTEYGSYIYPNVLQVLEGVPHYKVWKCKQIFAEHYITNKRHICAGGNVGYDACVGDSGGPLWMMVDSTPLLYGITSFGYGCGFELPGVYTQVSWFRRWIEKKVNFNLPNPCNCAEESDSCKCYEWRRRSDPDFHFED